MNGHSAPQWLPNVEEIVRKSVQTDYCACVLPIQGACFCEITIELWLRGQQGKHQGNRARLFQEPSWQRLHSPDDAPVHYSQNQVRL